MKANSIGPARAMASGVGAPLAAFALSAALVAHLPLGEELAFAVGVHMMVPLWTALACVLPLAESGPRAWAYCAVLTLLPGASLLF